MPNSDQRTKVTLEDLLQLKKAERPAAEFWSEFDRELRQKQLLALVEKPSWWHGLPSLFSRRIYLPIGATAILTFTLVSVKYSSPRPTVQADQASTVSVPAARDLAAHAVAAVASPTVVSSPLINRADATTTSGVQENSAALARVSAPADARSSTLVNEDAVSPDSPSARSIAANLARLEQSEPELLNSVLGQRLSSPARVQASSTSTVELASLSLSSSRRNRLLAHYTDHQVVADSSSTDAVRERLARRLGDGDFNDHYSRIGLNGNRVSLKF